MPTRYSLPWSDIQQDVLSAVDSTNNGKRFVNCRYLVDHIDKKRDDYPFLKDSSYRALQTRVVIAFNKMGWKRFNRKTGRRSPVFIDERYAE